YWDQRYRAADYVYGKGPNDFVREHAARIPPGRVLCLGAGEGRNAVYLAELGHEVEAVDGSGVASKKTQALAAERAVEVATITADLADYVIETERWSGILAIFCHLPRPLRTEVHQGII